MSYKNMLATERLLLFIISFSSFMMAAYSFMSSPDPVIALIPLTAESSN
jgi:hypothetical protein